MNLFHESLIKALPKQNLQGLNKEIAMCIASNLDGIRHSTVQYALDNPVEQTIAYRLRFYDYITENNIFNIDERCGILNYINNKRGINPDIDIKLVLKYYTKDGNVFDEHDDDYLIECLDNLWYKMTGDTLRWDGKQYPIKTKKSLCDMFKKHFKWYIDMKSEQLSEAA